MFLRMEVSMTMFPQHVEPCCKEQMSAKDVVLTDSAWRDVDRDIMPMDMLMEDAGLVTVVNWWEMLDMEGDIMAGETHNGVV
jgi:hypothetical protein